MNKFNFTPNFFNLSRRLSSLWDSERSTITITIWKEVERKVRGTVGKVRDKEQGERNSGKVRGREEDERHNSK